MTGLNLARTQHMHFGKDIIFTYGPWGFLDVPLALDRGTLALGLTFSAAATAVSWWALQRGLRAIVSPAWAGFLASVICVLLSASSTFSQTAPSLLVATSAAALALHHVGQTATQIRAWEPPALAATAALLLQVKFSDGLFATCIAGILVAVSPRATARLRIVSFVSFVFSFLCWWTLAGQSVSSVPSWLSGSLQFVKGYSSAMPSEDGPSVAWALSTYALVPLLFGGTLWLIWADGKRRRAKAAMLLVAWGTLFFGFKQGFTRHDVFHNPAFFVAATFLLVAVLAVASRPRPWPTLLLLLVAVSFASPALTDRSAIWTRASSLGPDIRALTDGEETARILYEAKRTAQDQYNLAPQMAGAARGHPTAVDPWDASVAWAYSLKWHPWPIFQTYSAYTHTLDRKNSLAAIEAPTDQRVLRTWEAIDGRNPLWDSPQYTVALACHYRTLASDDEWMLLGKRPNRCAAPAPLGGPRDMVAGERVEVPIASTNSIVTASFTPAPSGVLRMAAGVLAKDFEPLTVAVDGTTFRLADGLARGPLIVALPGGLWPSRFGGDTSYDRLVFNEPGIVQFHTIEVAD